jgi:glycosyltransferase involved in cell wall biosynthesis
MTADIAGRPIGVLQLLVSTRTGGGPGQVYETIRRMRPDEFRWVIGAPDDGPYFARFGSIGAVHRLSLDRLAPGTLVDLVRLIRAERIDVVHSHGKGAGVFGRIAASLTGIAAIHTFHGIHDAKYGRLGGALYRTLERWLARRSFAIVNVSESQARDGARLGLWPADRAVVITNGIDAEATRALVRDHPLPVGTFGVRPGEPVVACIARLDPVKGVDVFVRAVARLTTAWPSLRAVIVGAGGEARSLEALAAGRGIAERVVFAGDVPDAPRIFAGVDVFVAPSRGEGLPLALLEAMACGMAIVASRIPVHEEVLAQGRAGLLARVDDADDLADGMRALLGDPALRVALGAEARKEVERFDIAETAEGLAALYRRAARSRPSRPRRSP